MAAPPAVSERKNYSLKVFIYGFVTKRLKTSP